MDPQVSGKIRTLDFVIASASSFFCCVVTFNALPIFALVSAALGWVRAELGLVSSWSAPNLSEWDEWSAFARSQLWLDLIACAAAAPIAWICSRIGFFTFPASVIVGCAIGLAVYFSYFGADLTGVFPPPPMMAAVYGASASTVYFVTLNFRRPMAFRKRWHNRTILIVLLLLAILIMLYPNWIRAVGLNISVAP